MQPGGVEGWAGGGSFRGFFLLRLRGTPCQEIADLKQNDMHHVTVPELTEKNNNNDDNDD